MKLMIASDIHGSASVSYTHLDTFWSLFRSVNREIYMESL